MPCFLAGVGGEIGDLHFSLDENKCIFTVSSFILKSRRVLLTSPYCFQADFYTLLLNIAVFAENRITPPSPHCLRL